VTSGQRSRPSLTALRSQIETIVGAPLAASCQLDDTGDPRVRLLDFLDGQRAVLKFNAEAPTDMAAAEAAGLRAIAGTNTIRVVTLIAVLDGGLLLGYVAPGRRTKPFWHRCGRQLAAMHGHLGTAFGFESDNYCGMTRQSNRWQEDGYAFFAEQRLIYQAALARDRNLLGAGVTAAVERLAARLPELVPVQPPSLLHGDLWSGNLLAAVDDGPVLIDPACYYGWAETDLAMTVLFGGFGEDFYRAYEDSHRPESGWRQRLPIYNLYHLLNHLNLFGTSYLPQITAVLDRFG